MSTSVELRSSVSTVHTSTPMCQVSSMHPIRLGQSTFVDVISEGDSPTSWTGTAAVTCLLAVRSPCCEMLATSCCPTAPPPGVVPATFAPRISAAKKRSGRARDMISRDDSGVEWRLFGAVRPAYQGRRCADTRSRSHAPARRSANKIISCGRLGVPCVNGLACTACFACGQHHCPVRVERGSVAICILVGRAGVWRRSTHARRPDLLLVERGLRFQQPRCVGQQDLRLAMYLCCASSDFSKLKRDLVAKQSCQVVRVDVGSVTCGGPV